MNDQTKRKCELAYKTPCDLGETPVWDTIQKRVIWVDITRGEIHWYFPDKKEHGNFKTGQLTGSVALTQTGTILAALKAGLVIVDLKSGMVTPVIDPLMNLPDIRFNDGKCDPAGRFWVGTMSMSGKDNAGSLYALDHDLKLTTKIKNVSISNGLEWDKKLSVFYFIDTVTNQVAAYDYDCATGSIKNKRVAIEIPKEIGYPDGMTIDSEGMLWIALWDGWAVGRWNPHTGEMIDRIDLPVSRPTSCAFGGKDLRDLYISSARFGISEKELKDQPLAGSLFVLKKIACHGFPCNRFKVK